MVLQIRFSGLHDNGLGFAPRHFADTMGAAPCQFGYCVGAHELLSLNCAPLRMRGNCLRLLLKFCRSQITQDLICQPALLCFVQFFACELAGKDGDAGSAQE